MSWKMTADQQAEQEAKVASAIDALLQVGNLLDMEIQNARIEGRLEALQEQGLPAARFEHHSERLKYAVMAVRRRLGTKTVKLTAAEVEQLVQEALR